jgi:hypothetical protein
MKCNRALLAIAIVAGSCLPAFAQSARIDHGVATGPKKFGFYWETRLEPGTPPLEFGRTLTGGTTSSSTEPYTVYRVVGDRSRHVYFGYQARVDVLAEPNTYQITFSPVDPQFALGLLSVGEGKPVDWTQLSTPGWGTASPQTIHLGDVIAMDLLRNPTTGQRIVDYVTVQEPARSPVVTFGNVNDPPREFAFATGEPRDFRQDDGELHIRAARVSVNGKLDPSTAGSKIDVSGVVVWFYLPNRGRFLLSLTPHPDLGFRKAGEVRGSTLSFTVGSEAFMLVAGGAIAPTQAAFNLYVLQDPTWKPDYPNANLSAFIMGAADRAEALVRK